MKAYEIYVVTSILCGLVAAGIARAKGKSPVQWFFIGALANVVLLAVVLFFVGRKSQTDLPPGTPGR